MLCVGFTVIRGRGELLRLRLAMFAVFRVFSGFPAYCNNIAIAPRSLWALPFDSLSGRPGALNMLCAGLARMAARHTMMRWPVGGVRPVAARAISGVARLLWRQPVASSVAAPRQATLLQQQFTRLMSGGAAAGEKLVVKVPGMGDSITEGGIVEWVKGPGAVVNVNDVVVVIETDKVNIEVRSEHAGRILETFGAANDNVLDPEQRLSTEEEGTLREVLARVSDYVTRVQQDIVTPFTNFDRSRRGVVTAEQFKRVAKQTLEFLAEADVAIVLKAFQAPDAAGKMDSLDATGANRTKYVGYKWFVAAVDNADGVLGNLPSPADPRMESIPNKGAPAVPVAGKLSVANRVAPVDNVDPNVTAADALRRVAQLQVLQRKTAREFLEQYDPARRGSLTIAKFEAALDNAGFALTRSEQSALEREYAHPDPKLADMVVYRNLLLALDSTPAEGGERAAVNGASLGDLDDVATRGIVAKLAHIVQQRRIQCKNAFLARDTLREGTLTPAQFRGVVVGLGLKQHISDEALESLVEVFRSKKDAARVDYRRFLALVDV